MNDRFMAKVSPEPNTGCWLWTGHVSKDGYGRFGIKRTAHEAHRVSYRLFTADIPDGLCVDHICKVRSCVNPDHLRLLTREENSRQQNNFNRSKLTCSVGHPLVERNGRRICKPCQAKKSMEYRRRNAE